MAEQPGKNPCVAMEEIRQVPFRHRVAWTCIVVGEVVELYSAYARQQYLQQQAVEVAWSFVLRKRDVHQEARNLCHEILALTDEAREEGYTRSFLQCGYSLLQEMLNDTGRWSIQAVDSACDAFASHQLFLQGVHPSDPAIPRSYIRSVGMRVWCRGRELFDRLQQYREIPRPRPELLVGELDLVVEPLAQAVKAMATMSPPIQEIGG